MKLPTASPRNQAMPTRAKPLQAITQDAGLAVKVAELQGTVASLQAQIAILTAALSIRDIELPATDSAAMPSCVDLDAREAFDAADGFNRLEYGNGAAYRWTGPSHEATMRLWLNRSRPLVLEMRLHSYGDPRNRGAVSLIVDGRPVALAFDDMVIRSAAWPTHGQGRFSTVTLHVPHLSRPSDAHEMDERVLGIAFITMLVTTA